ncbi:MAG: LacI family DNA-binding transcriptional regulator [Bacteroidales bacterium]|nr:LacI family DNA-binding transcriptional regulator [Bacteroidales bacterium]MBR4218305.1 LacI family DNA-binding transcriptional regulator [Bacteroidales bacterium]
MEQPKKVMTKKGTGKQLARRFGVSAEYVSRVLRGQGQSSTAKNIRVAAVKDYEGIAIY